MKKILIIISLFVAVGCATKKNQIKICDDRLMNSSIINGLLNQYFNQKELVEIEYFILIIGEKQDSLKMLISPLIQKRDSLSRLPTSYITYDKKKIFVILPLFHLLPIDNNSLTVKKYKEVLGNIPKYINTDSKKYPVWRILIKNNKYKIDSLLYFPNLDPSFKFIPPVIPKNK